ncbi:MAG TPA: response regulator [Dehalococcoidia bacterium]|nr:response regulator [Dehalococcoidia bacterium]
MPKVLVVDDDPRILRLVQIALAAPDIEVVPAKSGREALAALGSGIPDLAILDLLLPDDSVEALIRALRAKQHVPVLLLSAWDPPEVEAKTREWGASDFLTKPFIPDDLVSKARTLLDGGPHTG